MESSHLGYMVMVFLLWSLSVFSVCLFGGRYCRLRPDTSGALHETVQSPTTGGGCPPPQSYKRTFGEDAVTGSCRGRSKAEEVTLLLCLVHFGPSGRTLNPQRLNHYAAKPIVYPYFAVMSRRDRLHIPAGWDVGGHPTQASRQALIVMPECPTSVSLYEV